MTKHEIAVLTIRVLGIYFLIIGLVHISTSIVHWGGFSSGFFLTSVSYIVVAGVLLWWLANPLSCWIFRGSVDSSEETHAVLPENFQRIAFTTMGLYLLITKVPSLVSSYIFYFRTSDRELSNVVEVKISGQSTIIGTSIGILFGILLICFSGYLSRMLSKGKTR